MATGRKQPSGFKDIRYNVKTVMRLFKDTDGIIKGIIENKDRTLVHNQDEVIVEPTLLDWQVVIDKNKGKKDFKLNNNLNKAVEIERKSIEKDNSKFEEELSTESDNTDITNLNRPEDYHEAIKKAIGKLSQTEKAKKQTVIAEEKLPKAYQKVTDMESLKKYLKIVSE